MSIDAHPTLTGRSYGTAASRKQSTFPVSLRGRSGRLDPPDSPVVQERVKSAVAKETVECAKHVSSAAAAILALQACARCSRRTRRRLGFFITSVGTGDGANLGGIAGADAHCQKLGGRGRCRQSHVARVFERSRRTESRSAPRIASAPARGSTPRACRSPPTSPSCTARRNKLARKTRSPRRVPSSTAAATSRTRTTS